MCVKVQYCRQVMYLVDSSSSWGWGRGVLEGAVNEWMARRREGGRCSAEL